MALASTSRIGDSVRLFGAGLFVFTFTIGLVVLLSWLFPNAPYWLAMPVILTVFFGSIIAALVFFHGKFTSRRSEEEILADRLQLEQSGMLISEPHRALRAFQLEEFEDEGSHYFLELEDHSVLYLSGQFLYEYEPMNKRPRRFPCAQFTIRRHKDDGRIVDLLCSGEVLEPELTVPALVGDEFEKYGSIADGQIISGKSYEEVKAERLATTRNRR
jgi:hypothetical protein